MLLVILLLAGLIGVFQCSCPDWDREVYIDCFCTQDETKASQMSCWHLNSHELLMKYLNYLKKNNHEISSLNIYKSNFSHFPHNAFDGVNIEKISIEDSEIKSLSDRGIAFKGLENTLKGLKFVGWRWEEIRWDWQKLRRMRQLKWIDIKWSHMPSIDIAFPPLLNLAHLSIMRSGVTTIVDGAFRNLSGLEVLVLSHNQILVMTRNMWPNPAPKLKVLDLSGNNISSLPEDFFAGMPRLETVSLGHNKLNVLPESTYKSVVTSNISLQLTGQYFFCDCQMEWLAAHNLNNRTYFERLFCTVPRKVRGKSLNELKKSDFNCTQTAAK